jgi:hypothetical protein
MVRPQKDRYSKLNVFIPFAFIRSTPTTVLTKKSTFAESFAFSTNMAVKDKAKDPEQQLYAVQGRVNDREMRIATFTKPLTEEISPKSKLARFKLRYKRFPALGMKVDVVTDENGYWKMIL